MLEQIEWEKKKKALVCGVDAEKLPLKGASPKSKRKFFRLKRKLFRLK